MNDSAAVTVSLCRKLGKSCIPESSSPWGCGVGQRKPGVFWNFGGITSLSGTGSAMCENPQLSRVLTTLCLLLDFSSGPSLFLQECELCVRIACDSLSHSSLQTNARQRMSSESSERSDSRAKLMMTQVAELKLRLSPS